MAGLYGALHNQISFTVSPEYFYAFKFHQFHIPHPLQGRLGASIVGWCASWWMGVIIAVPVLIVARKLSDAKSYLRHCLIAFGIVTATALVTGLAALAYALIAISETSLPGYWYPSGILDKAAFARAATMHNFSYLGGLLGIITASLYLIRRRRQTFKKKSY